MFTKERCVSRGTFYVSVVAGRKAGGEKEERGKRKEERREKGGGDVGIRMGTWILTDIAVVGRGGIVCGRADRAGRMGISGQPLRTQRDSDVLGWQDRRRGCWVVAAGR